MLRKGLVIVLASGGIDSSGAINFYLRRNYDVKACFLDYGQPSLNAETKAVSKVAKYYSIELEIQRLGFSPALRQNEYLCRNAVFVFAAASLGNDPAKIAMGIHSDSPYFDCSPHFVRNAQLMLDGYFGGTVRVEAPFLEFSKPQIVQYCKKHRVPLSLTYSCVRGNVPCKTCSSCMDRQNIIERPK